MRRFFIIINIVILQVNFYNWYFKGIIIKLIIDMHKGFLCMVYKKRGTKTYWKGDEVRKNKSDLCYLALTNKKPRNAFKKQCDAFSNLQRTSSLIKGKKFVEFVANFSIFLCKFSLTVLMTKTFLCVYRAGLNNHTIF